MTCDLSGQIRPLRPKENVKTRSRTIHTVQKLLEITLPFFMQLYWSILHIFCVMTFDIKGQIQPLRPKRKFQNPINQELYARYQHQILYIIILIDSPHILFYDL